MTKELKMLVGVALLVTLALAGALGIFTFSAAQPVGAQEGATRSHATSVAPGGILTVTIAPTNLDFGLVVETLPSDFTYVGSSLHNAQVDDTSLPDLVFTLIGGASFTYEVRALSTASGPYVFTGLLQPSDNRAEDVTILATTVTVGTSGTDGTTGDDAAAPATPLKLSSKVAGDAVQVVANANAEAEVSSATDIVVDLKKFGVPSSITEGSVIITGTGGDPQAYVGEPSSVTVSGTKVTIALYSRFPGQSTATGAGTLMGPYKVTFKQSAGITNPIVAGTATVTVKDADAGVETIKEKIQSKVKLSAAAGARGTAVTVSVVGIGKGGATVYLVKGCPDQRTNADGMKDCDEENDISLGNAESSGGKISVEVETSSSDFDAGVKQVDKDGNDTTAPYITTDALRGLNRIAIVDGTGRTTDKDAYFQITPTIETDEEGGKQGDEITILVEDWYYGGVARVTVGDETAPWDGPMAAAIEIDDGDGEIDILLPNAARLGEQQLKVIGSTLNNQGSLTAGDGYGTADAATGSVVVQALDIELDPSTVVLGQQFTVKVKGFSDENPKDDPSTMADESDDSEIQYVKVGDITLSETTGGVGISALTIDTNGDFTNTFVVKSTYQDPVTGRVAEDVLDPGTYRVEVKDHTGRIAIGHLTYPEPEISIDPSVSRRGTTVTVVGKNFPSGRVVSLFYDEDDDDDLLSAMLADSAGRFRSSFTVPSNAEIGEEQDILAISAANENKYKTKAIHSLPPQELIITPEAVSAGGRLTIEGHNMPLFTLVHVNIADIGVSGRGVETDGLGSFTIEEVLVPQLRPGSHTVEAEVQTQGEEPAKVRKVIQIVDIITRDSEEAFADLIDNGTLSRVWYLQRDTQEWFFYDPAPEFAPFNTLTEVSSGQIVDIIMTARDTFQGETLYVGSNPTSIE